ncbi:MAG: SHOCT domain-containing protein [Chloroflexota bacterium]
MMGYGFGTFGGMGLGMLWGTLVGLAIIGLLVWAVIAFAGPRRHADETPLELVKRRFARGEISEAEFEQAKRRLA